MAKWNINLSTTDENHIGLVKVRMDNNSEVFRVHVTENSKPYDFTNNGINKVYFNTKFQRFGTVQEEATIIDAKNGIIEYTLTDNDMQQATDTHHNHIQLAYFEFRKDDDYVASTQTFGYHIMSSIYKECTDGQSYIVRLEELFKLYQDFMNQQSQSWVEFVESNREILENIDPGGVILTELIDFRHSNMLDKTFDRIKNRGYFWDNSFKDLAVNVKWFGAKGDGVTNEDDSINRAIAFLEKNGGGILYFPQGVYLVNFVLKVTGISIVLRGAGELLTTIKVKDQSDLLHAERDYTSNKNTSLDNLFRDFHAVFFFENCDIDIKDITIFGNSENNYIMLDDKKYNYYAATIHSDLGITGYRYYHGIDVLWRDGKAHKFYMKNTTVHQFPWNNVAINNQGIRTEADIKMKDNLIESSAQDGVSIHKVYGDIKISNRVKNANSHATHLYHTVEDVEVLNEEYIYTEDDYYNFEPNVPTELRKHGLQIGHGSYVDNFLQNITVKGCHTTIANNVTYHVTGLFIGKTVKDLYLYDNDFSKCDYPIMVYPFVMGDFVIDNCKLDNYTQAGILINVDGLADSLLDPRIESPYKAEIDIRNSSIVSQNQDKNAIRFVLPGNSADDHISKIKINLLNNSMSACTISQSDKIDVDDNNSLSPNLLDMSFEVVDGAAQGWRGRNSTNAYTTYTKQTGVFSDVGGQQVALDFLKINTSKNPSTTFDAVIYTQKSRLSKGSHVFRCILRNDNAISCRLELRNSAGDLLSMLVPETKLSASSSFSMNTFYFDIEETINSTNQFLNWVISADNSTNKISNLYLTGAKLEKTDRQLPKMTRLNLNEYTEQFYSITTVPNKAGLITIGGGDAYISTGNTKVSDWKKIT